MNSSFINGFRKNATTKNQVTGKEKDIAEKQTEVKLENNQIPEVEEKQETQELKQDIKEEKAKSTILKDRKKICLCKMGTDHIAANMNNHDFAFNLLNMKVVLDGCGSGKHSEIGTRLFGQLFASKTKELYLQNIIVDENNFEEVVKEVINRMLELSSNIKFIFENYCFTILVCFEMEDEFVVLSCGDGFIIKEDSNGITFEKLDDGEYPCYYIYNFIEDKEMLKEYKDGVTFEVRRYSKEQYLNVGVATDGLRFTENLVESEKTKLFLYLCLGKKGQIEKLINRNNANNTFGSGMFHDDISICF